MKKKKVIIKKKLSKSDQDLINLSKKICKIIHNSNKDFIRNWLEVSLKKRLNSLIEDAVIKEFRIEVIPLIIGEIDKKIQMELKNIHLKVIKEVKSNIMSTLLTSLQIKE